MPMPANGIISKCKIKLSRKILPVYKLTSLKIRHSFLECLGSIFLDYYILLCDMQIGWQALVIAVRPSWAGCEFLTELAAPAHFVVINKGARQFYLSSDTR